LLLSTKAGAPPVVRRSKLRRVHHCQTPEDQRYEDLDDESSRDLLLPRGTKRYKIGAEFELLRMQN
jgi:hypothetical protein